MAVIHRTILLTALILAFSSTTFGLYFIVDYFMDHGIPKAFGQACDDYIHDDCSYIQSHINTFGDFDYRGHVRCKLTLDAGSKPGATWKLKWLRFKVEATNCSDDKDYLEFYDMSLHYYHRLRKRDPFMARYCGWTYPAPNLTDALTQRYFTFLWRTDGSREDKGWRVMATRVYPDPYCPTTDFFRCKAENICMDSRLKCDGVPQCDDQSDESDCTAWEELVGGFLALGTAGVTAISLILTFVYVLLFFGIKYLIKKLRPKPEDQVVRIELGDGTGGGAVQEGPKKKSFFSGFMGKISAKVGALNPASSKNKADMNKDKMNSTDEKQALGASNQPPPAAGVTSPRGPPPGVTSPRGPPPSYQPVVITAGSVTQNVGKTDGKGAGLPGAVEKDADKKQGTAAPGGPGATGEQKAGDKKADTNAPGGPNAKAGAAGVTNKTDPKTGANAPGAPTAKAGDKELTEPKADAKDTADSKKAVDDTKVGGDAKDAPKADAGAPGAPKVDGKEAEGVKPKTPQKEDKNTK